MKKLTILLVLLSFNTLAAENISWDGFYGSALLGGDFGDVNKKNGLFKYYKPDGTVQSSNVVIGNNSSLDGITGNLKLGFNKQLLTNNIIGIELGSSLQDLEADGIAIAKYGSTSASSPDGPPYHMLSKVKIKTYESLSIKFGHIFNKTTLAYISGGAALGQLKSKLKDDTGSWIDSDESITDDKNEFGYIVGFGLEHKLNDKFSLRANYEYVDFGDVNFKYTGYSTNGATVYSLVANQNNSVHFSNLSAGISYQF